MYIFQRSAVRTGICAYKDTTPLQTRPALINRTVSVLFKKRCQSVLCVDLRLFFVCLYVFTTFHKKF